MRKIAVIDAETDPFRKGRIPAPFVWGYYDGSQYRQFEDTAKLIKFLRQQYAIVYAHNGGKFDFHFLLPYLDAYQELTIINGRIARCYIGDAELRDSYCIINEPLSKYKKDDIDYAIMESDRRKRGENWQRITSYLKSDCVYLWEMVTDFIRRFGPELTLASAAMKQWIKVSGSKPEPTDDEFYAAFYPYYYGGRVECFRSGIIETDFAVYDINSAYPYAMLHKHPYSASYQIVDGYINSADFVKVSCISKGAFPYRGLGESNVRAGLSFPSDNEERIYTVTNWEFCAAMETKTIKKVKVLSSIVFTKHTDFSVYINKFWQEREEAKAKGDILGSLFSKLIMNSLYGKFAANPENYNRFMIVPPKDITEFSDSDPDDKWKFGGDFGPWLLATAELTDFEKRYYNVATGASITGFVRAMLWRAICNSKGVLYCDTDSISVQQCGKKVPIGSALGQWKQEGIFNRAGIAGKKLYIFQGYPDKQTGKPSVKKASKGVRLSDSEIWKIAKGGIVKYESEVPTFSVKKGPVFTNRSIVKTA